MRKKQTETKQKVLATVGRIATAGATLCTTLMVLGVFSGGGTGGPKLPASAGE